MLFGVPLQRYTRVILGASQTSAVRESVEHVIGRPAVLSSGS